MATSRICEMETRPVTISNRRGMVLVESPARLQRPVMRCIERLPGARDGDQGLLGPQPQRERRQVVDRPPHGDAVDHLALDAGVVVDEGHRVDAEVRALLDLARQEVSPPSRPDQDGALSGLGRGLAASPRRGGAGPRGSGGEARALAAMPCSARVASIRITLIGMTR